MSIAFLGESVHIYHAIGMVAIIAGLACSGGTFQRIGLQED
jgi:hypothetical protein